MRHPRILALTVLLTAAVAACSGASAGWTYAPAPPATPVPSGSPSGEPSTPASGEPSAPSDSAGPSASAGASTVTITAKNIAFTTPDVSAPAAGFTLAFDNEDAGVPHDIEIKDAAGTSAFKTDIFPGVETRTYTVPALAPGAYTFACTVHANMTGTLTVQ